MNTASTSRKFEFTNNVIFTLKDARKSERQNKTNCSSSLCGNLNPIHHDRERAFYYYKDMLELF